MGEPEEASSQVLRNAVKVLLDTWQQGRKVLVVLGAGVSVAADIPLMRSVYSDLATRFPKNLDDSEKNRFLISEIQAQLNALAAGDAPRSLAAMALGTLQRAHERLREDKVFKKLEETWDSFSKDFIAGKIENTSLDLPHGEFSEEDIKKARRVVASHPFGHSVKIKPMLTPRLPAAGEAKDLDNRVPTQCHYCVSRWAEQGWAHLVSVNFDGLTRKALQDTLDQDAKNFSAVVLSQPESIGKFALGDDAEADFSVPVVKVWGDVFHAVCTNARCPESGIRVPIFRLKKGPPNETDHDCPSCHKRRQLQIFFTGYEEKEKTTKELMGELLRFMAPQLGCVVTIGFSGLWDQALVQFIGTICNQIDHENRATNADAVSCICVDPVEHPSLLHDMALNDVRPLHLRMKADEFASIFDLTTTNIIQQPIPALPPHRNEPYAIPEGMWDDRLKSVSSSCLPGTYSILQKQHDYLPGFSWLRQLGIKTLVAQVTACGAKNPDDRPSEADHNRLRHSRGAGHLSVLWFRQLAKQLPMGWQLIPERQEQLCAMTLYSAMHHDIGHLPFTHLAEEIFGELRWSLQDWDLSFKHEEPVLAHPFENFKSGIDATSEETAKSLGLDEKCFRHWAECAIHGRSGYPWIDAILNSPLDVDKLDYVFRDCHFLGQGLHISVQRNEAWEWMQRLFRGTRVLPSGLVALEGTSGEQARNFLEERWWLYRHQYFQPGFRAC